MFGSLIREISREIEHPRYFSHQRIHRGDSLRKSSSDGGSNVEGFDEPTERRLLTGIPNPNAKKSKQTKKK